MTNSDRNLPVTGSTPAAKMQPGALDNSMWKVPGQQPFSPLLSVLDNCRKESAGPMPAPDWATPAGKAALAAKNGGMKFDGGKPKWSLLLGGCAKALRQVLGILEFGVIKYDVDSWKTVPQDKYLDALMRHLAAINEHGLQHVDEESGKLSIAHLSCDALFLTHFATVEAERQAREATR
jgi:hypothetical protein